MSLTVVATLRGKPGRGPEIIEAFQVESPLVHRESGCELYAAHLEQDGDTVVMVERWTTRADLDAHAAAEPFARLSALFDDLLASPLEVLRLDAVPLGDPAKGAIPA